MHLLHLLGKIGSASTVEVIFNFCRIVQTQDSLRLEKYCKTISLVWPPENGNSGRKLAAVVYYRFLFTLEHSLKAHTIMACMYSEEGGSLRLPAISILIPPPH